MVNVTKKFMQQLYNDQRNYLVRVVINLADTNQTVLTLNNENIWGFSPTVEDAVSADEELQIGTAIINKFSFTINNIYGTYSAYDFKYAKVFLTVGLDVGNNTVERIKKGTFYVDTADYNDTFIVLECLDGMHKLEKPYKTSAVTFPATADYVVQNICTACGVINDTPNFQNKSFIINNAPDKDTCTYREVLSWVAQICGCFARFNSEGHLELKWYDRQSLEDIMDGLDGGVFDSVSQSRYTTGDTADGGTFNPWNTGYEFDAGDFDDMIKDVHLINSAYSQSMSVDDVVVTGVRILVKTKDTDNTDVIASHVTGTEGYVIEISENPFITEANVATILSYLGTQLVGLTFRKANLSIPSDPSFEAGDVAIYFDKNGNYHPILVSRTTFITGDAQTIVSSAQTPARNSAERYSAETKNYVATQKQIRAEKTARELMYDDLQEQMANASGLYYTEVEDPQTHAVTVYYHNKQELEESDIQIVISNVGITVTDDGGDHWYGLEVNGTLIASILSVDGVNAGWINSGQLVIEDSEGNETFFADADTGVVRINPSKAITSLGAFRISNTIDNTVSDDSHAYKDSLFVHYYGTDFYDVDERSATFWYESGMTGMQNDEKSVFYIYRQKSPYQTWYVDPSALVPFGRKETAFAIKKNGECFSRGFYTSASDRNYFDGNGCGKLYNMRYVEIVGQYNPPMTTDLFSVCLPIYYSDIGAYGIRNYFHIDNTGKTYLYAPSGTGQSLVLSSGAGPAKLVAVTSSSKRYKDIISDTVDISNFYNLTAKLAKYKDGYLVEGDELEGKSMPMLIAEDVDEICHEAAIHADGKVEDWNHRILIPVHQQMLVEQHKEIERLNKKVSDLEARLSRLEELLNGKS